MRLIVASFMLSALAATPALAHDKPFAGASVTAIVGIDHASTARTEATGIIYGGQLGYDFQAGNIVFGVEGEINGASTRYCYSGAFVANDRYCSKADRDLYIGGRLGTVVGGKTLLYVKGGYTNEREHFDYRDAGIGAGNYSGSGDHGGIRGGVGVETRIAQNLTAKAEYRYSDYSGSDYTRNQGVVGLGFHF